MHSPGAHRITRAALDEDLPGEKVACDPCVKGRRFRHEGPLWNWHMRMWLSGRASAFQADHAGPIPVIRSQGQPRPGARSQVSGSRKGMRVWSHPPGWCRLPLAGLIPKTWHDTAAGMQAPAAAAGRVTFRLVIRTLARARASCSPWHLATSSAPWEPRPQARRTRLWTGGATGPALLTQLAEYLALNQGVQGSSPWWRTLGE